MGAAGVITLDADGQHAPEEIPSFIAASLMILMPSSSAPAGHSAKMLQLAVPRESHCGFLDFMGGRPSRSKTVNQGSGYILLGCCESSRSSMVRNRVSSSRVKC